MRYFKRHWDEPRGDEHDPWGTSWWFFEVDDEAHPVRQLQLYESGRVLRYDASHLDDAHGGLGDQPLDLEAFAAHEISAEVFERTWSEHAALDR